MVTIEFPAMAMINVRPNYPVLRNKCAVRPGERTLSQLEDTTQYGLSFSLCSTQLEATRDRLREVSSYYDRSLRKLKADIAKVSNAGVWSTIKANKRYPNNNYYLNTKPCYGLIFMFYFAFSSLIYFRKPQKSKFFGSK